MAQLSYYVRIVLPCYLYYIGIHIHILLISLHSVLRTSLLPAHSTDIIPLNVWARTRDAHIFSPTRYTHPHILFILLHIAQHASLLLHILVISFYIHVWARTKDAHMFSPTIGMHICILFIFLHIASRSVHLYCLHILLVSSNTLPRVCTSQPAQHQ